jgi:hypothetical protein
MTTSRASSSERTQLEGSPQRLESPLQTDEDIAWEPAEGNLWIPHRIRGSWRGGVLG